MRMALRMAGVTPGQVGYLNAHATSTAVGDIAEATAIRSVFKDSVKTLAVSSTKSMTGHMLGAAGGAEAIFSVLAMTRGVLPPTANIENLDPAIGLDVIPNMPREKRVDVVLSNGFGFGGTNASLVFTRAG